jgi:hypothetical protein
VAALLVVALVLATGCSSTKKSRGPKVPASRVGESFLGGQLKIASIKGPTADRPEAVFVLANVADERNEGLIARTTFYTPPPPLEPGQLETPWETHNREQRITVSKGEPEATIVQPLPTGISAGQVWGVKLQVFSEPTVARGAGNRGTTYYDGALECVAMSNRILAIDPSISFTLENVSGAAIEDYLQFMLELYRDEVKVWDSGWQDIQPPIPPGKTVDIDPDLTDAETGRSKVRLRIRLAP